MRTGLVKRGLLAFGTLLLAVALLIALLPLIASTQIVRDRIAFELGAWSGYRVTLGEGPEIGVWPSFKARLRNVEFTNWMDPGEPPAIEAELIEVDLSPLAALRGEVVFSRLAMTRPLLRVNYEPGAIAPVTLPGGGRIARAMQAAHRAVEQEPVNPDLAALPDDPFGTIEFTDGRIARHEDGRDEPIVTSVAGRLSWPSLRRSASITATGIWRGESVAVEATSGKPLILLAGGDAPVRLSIESAPAQIAFEGTANLANDTFFQGQAKFASPSLRRFLEWSQTEIAAGASVGSLSVSGMVSGNDDRLTMNNVDIELNGNPGVGVLTLSVEEGKPTVAGTLAFRTLDLRSFLATLSPVAGGRAQMNDPVETELASQINLDLRLSATSAVLGELAVTEVAASVQVKQGLAAIDISDATAFGGTIQAGLRIDRAGESSLVEFRINAADVDAGAFSISSGMKRVVPQSRASLSLTAKGSGSDWNSVLATAEGTMTATLGEGTVIGFDLPAFLTRAAEGEFFALSEVSSGSLAISGAELKATLQGGVIRIDRSQAWSNGRTIAIDGIVPYIGRAFALSGQVLATPARSAEEEPLPPVPPEAVFFIGGGWDAPFVSPVLQFGDFQ